MNSGRLLLTLILLTLSALALSCGQAGSPNETNTQFVVQEKYSSVNFGGLSSATVLGSTVAQLAWNPHADAQVYLVYDVTSGTPQFLKMVNPPASSTYVTGLAPSSTYTYRVRLLDSAGLQDSNTSDQSVSTGTGDCYKGTVLADNPVLYLPMDESSGTTATDLGSAANDGTYGGNFTLGSDTPILTAVDGASVTFDGTSANIDLGNAAALQITGDQTIELWVKPASFNARRNPWAKSYGGEGTMTIETNRTINYYYGIGGNNTNPYQGFNSNATLTLNSWSHVVIVRDLTNMKLYWYIDGIQTNMTNASYAASVTSTLNAFVGKGYVSPFHGDIDEVAVYDRALSAMEIQEHHDAATTCP